MKLYFILPGFIDHSGHDNIFVEIFKKFLTSRKMQLELLIPVSNNIKINLKLNKFLLPNTHSNFKKIINFFIIFKRIYEFYKSEKCEHKDNIILDGGSLDQQLAIAAGIYFSNVNIQTIAIYCRLNQSKLFINSLIFKIILFYLDKSSKEKLILLTDNLPLSKHLSKTLKYRNFIMPIPHIITNSKNKRVYKKSKKKQFNFWLPGPIRQDKGISNIKLVLQNIEQFHSFKINLLLNENSKSLLKPSKNLKFLRSNMKRNDYISLFNNENNIIILPYSDPSYKYRTSGIFLEAISLGKLVFVSNGTFMADELKKHGLRSLVIDDWSNKDLISKVNLLRSDKNLTKLLLKMKNSYLREHGVNSYYKKLKQINIF